MGTNLTTLTLNLLISENKLHRIRLADRIKVIIDLQVGDFGTIEMVLRKQFLLHLDNCIDNPCGTSKSFLLDIADFYKSSYIEEVPQMLAAA